MLLVVCITLVSLSSCHAKYIFPEALVFQELGLPDMINVSDAGKNHNGTEMVAGNLNDALTTMSFHRYDFYLTSIKHLYNSTSMVNIII